MFFQKRTQTFVKNGHFLEKMVIFHEFWRFFDEAHGNAQTAFETVDSGSKFCSKNLHWRISLRRLKWS